MPQRKRVPGRAFCPECGRKYAVPEEELQRRPGLRFRATCRSCKTPFSVRWDDETLITEKEEILPQAEDDERDVLQRGARIGKYEIEGLLASGGSSAVYRAFESGANRTVALKVLHREPDSDYGVRFRREVEVQGNFKHQNVMPIFDQGAVDGKPFYTMELLHKPITLETVVGLYRSHRLGYNPALRSLNSLESILRRVFLPIVRAIDFSNRNGVVHRDLKPGNVLVDARTLRVYVIDFGICHLYKKPGQRLVLRSDAPDEVAEDKRMTMGTVRFMPPEQALGHVSEQGDVWALGALLFYLFKGDAPIGAAIDLRRVSLEKRLRNLQKLAVSSRQSGDEEEARFYEQRMKVLRSGSHRTMREVVRDAQEGVYAPMPDETPAPVADLIRKAMDKDPVERYPTAGHLGEDLERYLDGRPVRAYVDRLSAPAAALYRSRLLVRRNQTAFVAAAAVLLLGLAFFLFQILRAASAEEARIDSLMTAARDASNPSLQENRLKELLALRPANEEARELLALVQKYRPVKQRLERAKEVRSKVVELRASDQSEAADQLAADMAAVLENSVVPDLRELPENYVGRRDLDEAIRLAGELRGQRIVSVSKVTRGVEILLVSVRSQRSLMFLWEQPESWGVAPLLVPDHSLKPGSYVLLLRRSGRSRAIHMPFRFTHALMRKIDLEAPMDPARVPEGMIHVGGAERVHFGDLRFRERTEVVSIASFFLDAHEVTNAQYARFLADLESSRRERLVPRRVLRNGGTTPLWSEDADRMWQYPAGTANHPVTSISLADARAYAAWAGKRLPTEQEWEWAARGVDGRDFPFGNRLVPQACNAQTEEIAEVGSFPRDRSPFGAYDMAGNVAEWVADTGSAMATIKGGSFDLPRYRAIATSFGRRKAVDPYPDVGFRCAKDVSKKD